MSISKTETLAEDKRIIDQRLKTHDLSNQEYQKFLKTLPDDSAMAAELIVCQEEKKS